MAVLKYYNTATSAWEYIAASTTANFTTWKKTVAGGETSVSGTDDNAVTLSYTVGLEQVFINGVLQVRGTDYVATTGTSITGLSALAANDVVTVICYAPFNVANTIAPTLVDAKGDLIVATAADTVGRLAVGTNNQLLAADSSTSTGLKWANPGITLINTTSFSSVASVTIDDVFSANYRHYLLKTSYTAASAAATINLYFRSGGVDTTTNYVRERIYQYSSGINADEATAGMIGEISSSYPTYSNQSVEIMDPYTASKQVVYFSSASHVTNTGVPYQTRIMGYNGNTTQFTGLKVYVNTGTFSGKLSIYGVNE